MTVHVCQPEFSLRIRGTLPTCYKIQKEKQTKKMIIIFKQLCALIDGSSGYKCCEHYKYK